MLGRVENGEAAVAALVAGERRCPRVRDEISPDCCSSFLAQKPFTPEKIEVPDAAKAGPDGERPGPLASSKWLGSLDPSVRSP